MALTGDLGTLLTSDLPEGRQNLLTGCNETGYHCLNVQMGRDCRMPGFRDLRVAKAGGLQERNRPGFGERASTKSNCPQVGGRLAKRPGVGRLRIPAPLARARFIMADARAHRAFVTRCEELLSEQRVGDPTVREVRRRLREGAPPSSISMR